MRSVSVLMIPISSNLICLWEEEEGSADPCCFCPGAGCDDELAFPENRNGSFYQSTDAAERIKE